MISMERPNVWSEGGVPKSTIKRWPWIRINWN